MVKDVLPFPHSRSPVLRRYERQIAHRPLKIDRGLFNWAAVGVSPEVKTLEIIQPVREIGEFTHFALRRQWAASRVGGSAVALLLVGYKARREGNQIIVGGPEGCVCAYDLRFRPFPEARANGKILSSRKEETLLLGLQMDAALMEVANLVHAEARRSPGSGLGAASTWRLPFYPYDPEDPSASISATPQFGVSTFWAGFDDMPPVVDCSAARRLALRSVSPGFDGVLESLTASGGVITAVARSQDEILIGWNGTSDNPDHVTTLPWTAVLRPFCQVGALIEPGTVLADFMPRRDYGSWSRVAQTLGPKWAQQLLEDAVLKEDETISGLRCRRVELCPSLDGAVRIFEDVRPFLTEGQSRASIQVLRVRNPSALQGGYGQVSFDLYNLRPEWEGKFRPPGD